MTKSQRELSHDELPCQPGGAFLDVVKQALGHQRVLVKVDQVRCLGA